MLSEVPSVVAKGVFVEIALDMFSVDSVVRCLKPRFQIADDSMDPRQYLAPALKRSLDLGMMFVAESIDPPITSPVIGVDLAVHGDIFPNKRKERLAGSVRDGLESDASRVVPAVFHSDDDSNLASHLATDSSSPCRYSSDEGFVDLNYPRERLPRRVHSGSAQSAAKEQGCSVRTDAQLPLELQRRDSGAHRAHEIGRPKPVAQWQMTAMQYRASGDAHIASTFAAAQPAQTDFSTSFVAAPRTLEALGPAYLEQIVQACSFRGEPSLEFGDGPRESGVTLGRAFLSHLSAIFSNLVVPSA